MLLNSPASFAFHAHSLEYDRTWCVVDLEGTHVPKFEAISGRRVRTLYTSVREGAEPNESNSLNDNTHSVIFLLCSCETTDASLSHDQSQL
jgi:hypothetical protein